MEVAPVPKIIAVHTGADGATVSIDDPGTVTVYRRNQDSWESVRSKAVRLDKTQGLAGLRRSMQEIIEFIGESTVFAAAGVAGIPYFALEKAGLTVWEMEGSPPEIFEYILDKEEEQAQAENIKKSSTPDLKDLGGGRYTVNLIETQQNHTGATSKQILQPFFRKGTFYELEVICSHIPPWLEVELLQAGLICEAETLGESIKLTIRKQPCL